jgi:hypothetical protein
MNPLETANLKSTRDARDSPVFVDSPIVASEARQSPALASGTSPATSGSHLGALSYLIISGGTGANSIANAFGASPAFVLPVSDDGGSSSEILRCFGGPSIGDIREPAAYL